MRKLGLSIFLIISLLALGADLNSPEIPNEDSVVGIDNICTGFIVAKDVVLTAGHCFLSGDTLVKQVSIVSFSNKQRVQFKIALAVWDSAGRDFAILKGPTAARTPLKISYVPPRYEDRSGHVGFDTNHRAHPVYYPSVFVDTHHFKEDGIFYVYGGFSLYGNSGGPVFNEHAEVVGVMSRLLTGFGSVPVFPMFYVSPIIFAREELEKFGVK